MKFQNVPVGVMFKYQDVIYLKSDKSFAYDFKCTLLTYFQLELECELVTKCANCKWYLGNVKESDNNKFHCTSTLSYQNLPESASKSEENTYLSQDPETFSCSLFEMKGE